LGLGNLGGSLAFLGADRDIIERELDTQSAEVISFIRDG
jgi:hypothetical protein